MKRNFRHCRGRQLKSRHAFATMCVLASLAMHGAQAASLGRLFFTPEQRAQLDHAHARSATTENGSSILAANGIVQRTGGRRTVWINGTAQDAGHSDESSPDAVPVFVPQKSRPVKVKVGQQLLLERPIAQPQAVPGK